MLRQLITFQIGEQYLGVDIMSIREIRAWTPTTLLPHVQEHIRGVINLRGTVLPIIDLAARLGWGLTEPTGRHVIIVVRIGGQLQGLIVDSVNDIVAIEDADMQPPPVLGDDGSTMVSYLDGIASVENRMVMVLALDHLSLDLNGLDLAAAA